jgi:hypothetical protein
VANRSVYVIQVAGMENGPCAVSTGPTPADSFTPPQPADWTLWVDRETFVTVKYEARGAAGNLLSSYSANAFDVGVNIPASTFAAPAAAQTLEANSVAQMEALLTGQ